MSGQEAVRGHARRKPLVMPVTPSGVEATEQSGTPKLFGPKWAEGVRITFDENMKPPAAAMITQALATFLLAWTVGVTAANDALLTIILIVATIVLLLVANGYFCQKNGYARFTEAGYIVAMAIVMIVCQVVL